MVITTIIDATSCRRVLCEVAADESTVRRVAPTSPGYRTTRVHHVRSRNVAGDVVSSAKHGYPFAYADGIALRARTM
jgi:hypothetical protein